MLPSNRCEMVHPIGNAAIITGGERLTARDGRLHDAHDDRHGRGPVHAVCP
jgi:hypothetical protein